MGPTGKKITVLFGNFSHMAATPPFEMAYLGHEDFTDDMSHIICACVLHSVIELGRHQTCFTTLKT